LKGKEHRAIVIVTVIGASPPNITRQIKSRQMRWAGHVVLMGEDRKVCEILVGNSEGKRPLGIPRRRWEDGIRMDLREIGWG
jgi:hypothetical protein